MRHGIGVTLDNLNRRAGAVALASCILAATATAQDATPATRPTLDECQLIAALVAFDQRFVVDAYAAAPGHDPKWDADAHAFLAAQVAGQHNDNDDLFDDVPDALPQADRLKLAYRLLDGGCDEPMVCYQMGRLFEVTGDTTRAFKAFERGVPKIEASSYASAFKLAMMQAAFYNGHRVDERGKKTDAERLPRILALAKATVADKTLLPTYRRQVWSTAIDAFNRPDESIADALGDAIASVPDADAWLANVGLAEVEIKRAWAARGTGFANTVTAEGWREFARHLELARDHCRRAIEVDDALPQPCASMLTIAMGEDSDANISRAWFENTIARQVDYRSAYKNYLYSLLPRWGGTHVQMLQVGIDAVATGRFDTSAPSQLLYAISEIEDDMAEPLDERQKNRVYPDVVRCLDGYIAHSDRANVRAWARNARAAWAARLGRWDEAQVQFAAMNKEKIAGDSAAFETFGLTLDAARQQAAIAGASSAAGARDALAKPTPAGQLAALDDAIAKLPTNDAARPGLIARRSAMKFETDLASGGWTKLPLPAGLPGWRSMGGKWTVQPDGTLVGTGGPGVGIVCLLPLPDRYELRLRVARAKDSKNDKLTIFEIAPRYTGQGLERHAKAELHFGSLAGDRASLNAGGPNEGLIFKNIPIARDAEGFLKFTFRVEGEHVSTLDEQGTVVADVTPTRGVMPAAVPRHLAFGDFGWGEPNATWRIAGLEVRKLP